MNMKCLLIFALTIWINVSFSHCAENSPKKSILSLPFKLFSKIWNIIINSSFGKLIKSYFVQPSSNEEFKEIQEIRERFKSMFWTVVELVRPIFSSGSNAVDEAVNNAANAKEQAMQRVNKERKGIQYRNADDNDLKMYNPRADFNYYPEQRIITPDDIDSIYKDEEFNK